MSSAEHRARLSEGQSLPFIHASVADVLASIHHGRGTLVDVGCGQGAFRTASRHLVDRYIGVDIIQYEGFPPDATFVSANLDRGQLPLEDGSADAVVSIETIEHLENPRAFMRELARLVRPGGVVVVTTPNQLSLLSLVTLFVKGQFNAFQEAPGLYPAHITALLPVDLTRMARECGLEDPAIRYTNIGRIPLTAFRWPGWMRGQRFSDNLMLVARKGRPGTARP
jgi:2-polyprenyl-3-methyl-5-hydroxy-6-metoxy-1,4-benzoquinol methylase